MENNEAAPPNKRKIIAGGYLPAGDDVKINLAQAGATTEQTDAVLWLLTYGREHKLGHITALAKRLNVSATTLSRVFAGKYGAELTNLTRDIEHFRKLDAERKHFGDVPIVNLRVAQDVADLCELTRVSATMALLFGPNQSGKTWALAKMYQPRNNHGRTIYVRMRAGGGTRMFLEDLLTACGISERKSYNEMRARIVRYFDPSTLLIVDEVHQAMIGRSMRTVTIEAIREIHDLTGCGVVLCGTDVLPDMMDDKRFKKILGQTANRGVLRRRIPATPYPEDVKALCEAYGFPALTRGSEEQKLVAEIASTNGIGKLCKFFQMARRLANKKGAALTWEHLLVTHATLASWEKGAR